MLRIAALFDGFPANQLGREVREDSDLQAGGGLLGFFNCD